MDRKTRCQKTRTAAASSNRVDRRRDDADAIVTLDRAALNRVVLRELTFADAVERRLVHVDGDVTGVTELLGLLDDFTLMFQVVEPKRPAHAAPAPPGS